MIKKREKMLQLHYSQIRRRLGLSCFLLNLG